MRFVPYRILRCWAPVRWAQATMTGRLAYAKDIRAVANAMGVDEPEIAALNPPERIEKNMQTGQVSRGAITF